MNLLKKRSQRLNIMKIYRISSKYTVDKNKIYPPLQDYRYKTVQKNDPLDNDLIEKSEKITAPKIIYFQVESVPFDKKSSYKAYSNEFKNKKAAILYAANLHKQKNTVWVYEVTKEEYSKEEWKQITNQINNPKERLNIKETKKLIFYRTKK